jgi:hypothetical protein
MVKCVGRVNKKSSSEQRTDQEEDGKQLSVKIN